MKNNNSGWIWAIVVIVIVLAVVIGVRMHKNKLAMEAGTNDGTSMNGDDNAITPTEDISAGSIDLPATTGTAPVTMSYQNALIKYAGSRFQFDKGCVATPNTATFATGTNIMLDNRSPDTRSIHMGTLGTVSVKGYGFKIVNLSLAGLNMNSLAIDCDAHQNVATITVQK